MSFKTFLSSALRTRSHATDSADTATATRSAGGPSPSKSSAGADTRAERTAAPKPARIPSGDRRTYSFDEGLQSPLQEGRRKGLSEGARAPRAKLSAVGNTPSQAQAAAQASAKAYKASGERAQLYAERPASDELAPQRKSRRRKSASVFASARKLVSKALHRSHTPQPDTSMGVFGDRRNINRGPSADKSERPPRVRGTTYDVAGYASVEHLHPTGRAAALPPKIPAMDYASVHEKMKHQPLDGGPERNLFPEHDPAGDTRRLKNALLNPPAELDKRGADAPKLSRFQKAVPLSAPALHQPLMAKVHKTQRKQRPELSAILVRSEGGDALNTQQQRLMGEMRDKEAVRIHGIATMRAKAYIAKAERNLLDVQERVAAFKLMRDPQAQETRELRQALALRMVFNPNTLPDPQVLRENGLAPVATLVERLGELHLTKLQLGRAQREQGEIRPDTTELEAALERQQRAVDEALAKIEPQHVSRYLNVTADQVFDELATLRGMPEATAERIFGRETAALLGRADGEELEQVLPELANRLRSAEFEQRLARALRTAEDTSLPELQQAAAASDAMLLRRAADLGPRIGLMPTIETAASSYFAAGARIDDHRENIAATQKAFEEAQAAASSIEADIAEMKAHLQSLDDAAPALLEQVAATRQARRAAEAEDAKAMLDALSSYGFDAAGDDPVKQAKLAELRSGLESLYALVDERLDLPDGHPRKLEPRASSPLMVMQATVRALAEASGGDLKQAADMLSNLRSISLRDLALPADFMRGEGVSPAARQAAIVLAQVPRGMEVLQHLTGHEGVPALQGGRPLAADVQAVKIFLQAQEALGRTPEDQPELRQFRQDAMDAARIAAAADDPMAALEQATVAQRGAFHAFRNGMDSNALGTDYDAVNKTLLQLGEWIDQLRKPRPGGPMIDVTPLKALDQAMSVLDATGGPSLRRVHSDTLRIATEQLLAFAMHAGNTLPDSFERAAVQSLLAQAAYQQEDVDVGALRFTPEMVRHAEAYAAGMGLEPGQGEESSLGGAFSGLWAGVKGGATQDVNTLLQVARSAIELPANEQGEVDEPEELKAFKAMAAVANDQLEAVRGGRPASPEMFVDHIKYSLSHMQWRDRLKMTVIDTVGGNTDRAISIPIIPFLLSIQPKVIWGVDKKKEVSLEAFMSSPAGPQIVISSKGSAALELGAGMGVTVLKPVTERSGEPSYPGGRAAADARFRNEKAKDESISFRIPRHFGAESTLHGKFVSLMEDMFRIAGDAAPDELGRSRDLFVQLLAAQPEASLGRMTAERTARGFDASGEFGLAFGFGGKNGGASIYRGWTVRHEKADAKNNPRAAVSWPTADSTVSTRVVKRTGGTYNPTAMYEHKGPERLADVAAGAVRDGAVDADPSAPGMQQMVPGPTLFSVPAPSVGGSVATDTRVDKMHKRLAEQTYLGGEHYFDLAARGFETKDFKMFRSSVMARLSQWAELAAIRAPAGIPPEDRYALGEKFVLDLLAQGETIGARNGTTTGVSFDTLFQELDSQVDHLHREAFFASRRGDKQALEQIDQALDELFSDASMRKVALMHVSNTTKQAHKLGINFIAKMTTVWQGDSKMTMSQVPQANPIVDGPLSERQPLTRELPDLTSVSKAS